MKKNLILTIILWCALTPLPTVSQIATSPNFTLEKAVVAGGGGESTGATFSVRGTAGQSAAQTSSAGVFTLQSGFWSPNPFAPTAAGVTVAGKILTPDGSGLRNAIVTLTDSDGRTISTRTGSFGFYRFEGIRAGQSVVVTVISKRFQFEPRVLMLHEDLTDVNFTPQEIVSAAKAAN